MLPLMSDFAAFDAFEAAGWSTKEAAVYDSLLGRVTSRVADALLDAVGAGPGKRLLDVATGPGHIAASAVGRGAESVGLDFSEKMLAYARSRAPTAEFVSGDATALPFPDESFDAVTGAFVLLHLGRPERAVAEAQRVLRPTGRAAFTVWDEPSRGRWIGLVVDALSAAGAQPPADLPAGPSFFLYADETEFAGLLTDAGLVDVAVETVGFNLQLEGADALWDGVVEGTVRLRASVLGQAVDVQRRIRAHFDELLETYRVADGFEVPVSVKLASGRKP